MQTMAQHVVNDTTNLLPEFVTTANRFTTFKAGIKTHATDSLTKIIVSQNSLAQLLAYNSSVFVKSYGPMQLSTTSFRGAGAHHTAVLWNGINLQSNMNGQLDFSLIPAGFMDQTDIDFGGNAALYGTGAIGGAIMLNNTPQFKKQTHVSFTSTIGSFGQQQQWGSVALSTNTFYIKAKAYYSSAQNNFGFYDYTMLDKPLRYRQHANYHGTGTMLEAGYLINAKQQLNVRYWYSYNDRNLPPTIGMFDNNAYQIDESNRLNLEWKRTTNKHQLTVRSAWLSERLDYNDPSTFLTGRSKSHSFINEIENSSYINKYMLLNVGVNYSAYKAQSENYTHAAIQHRLAGFTSLKIKPIKKVEVSVNMRQELIDGKIQPFTALLGINYQTKTWLSVYANANKSYRVPTFNDLYWITGNRNLKPENGYGQELGVKFLYAKSSQSITTTFNVFNRNVDNWIMWQPNGGTWTPQNLLHVWSRGVEFNINYSYRYKRILFTLKNETAYTLSTNQKRLYDNDESVGKQLIQVPRLTHQNWFTIQYKNMYVAYNHTYTGYRFTTTDNSSFLPHYNLGNVFLGTSLKYKKCAFDVRLQYNNIYNTVYEVLPAKPMPMSNYLLTLNIKFNSTYEK
jgi:vitamin B12 transporter